MAYKDKKDQLAYQRKWYQSNKEKVIAENELRRKKLKKRFKAYKSTLSCIKCGENSSCCLDFHHVKPNQKDKDISAMIRNTNSWERIEQEMKKCIVVCKNCHAKIHANEL